MTEQQLLILSHFDRDTPKTFSDKDITAKMVMAGIGKNSGSDHPFYEIVHQLSVQDLIELYRDPAIKGVTRARGDNQYILTKMGNEILLQQR
ncbi:MAG: hypothetical protein V4539_01205 [Bacteroidota bacterium]